MGDDTFTLSATGNNKQLPARRLDDAMVREYIARLLTRRDAFLATGREHGSPLYVLDTSTLAERAREFSAAFQNRLHDVKFYYAIKSNNHPEISHILLNCGYGLDVSSGEELLHAIRLQARDIIFSGPGKTSDELALAVKHTDRVTVLIDSFGELDRLEQAAGSAAEQIRAGVRLCTEENGLWRKFGIPLSRLAAFIEKTQTTSHVAFSGLQFHISWNLNPKAQIDFLRRLGEELGKLDETQLRQISFIDIGGGYWPPLGEWMQFAASGQAGAADAIGDDDHALDHYYQPAEPIVRFARQIAGAIHEYIHPYVECTICLEPGRWLCHDAMHILLTVIDKKADDLIITDGGTNAVGWERFESDYFPVINLTRPGMQEHRCLVTGSLCTPHDIWGYGFWGEGIEPGDVLVVPSQGAYTYSLRQNFIKSIPDVVTLIDND